MPPEEGQKMGIPAEGSGGEAVETGGFYKPVESCGGGERTNTGLQRVQTVGQGRELGKNTSRAGSKSAYPWVTVAGGERRNASTLEENSMCRAETTGYTYPLGSQCGVEKVKGEVRSVEGIGHVLDIRRPVLRPHTAKSCAVVSSSKGETDIEVCQELVDGIMKTATSMFAAEHSLSRRELEKLVIEAVVSTDGNYGIQEANKWADGYQFPQELVDSDLRLFRASSLDFSAMVKRRLHNLGANRLSSSRIALLRKDNPERDRLDDIAEGMRVPLPIGFIPNARGSLTPLRPAYVDVHRAVDRMLGDLHAQGLAFCLPKREAIDLIEGLHLGKASWTPKKGKPSGRSIGDMSFCDGTPLNCDETKAMAESWWGKIELPTIEDITVMILDFFEAESKRDSSVKWEDLRLWKTDLRGAYQLMSFRPECAKYFGMEIAHDRIFIHLCGIFGWTCTPAAFQVISRAIQWELKHQLRGQCKMYVDDIVGVCLVADLEMEVQCAKAVCTRLLGPNAIAEDKTETGVRMDVLGYVLDLERKLVSISRKNFLNAVYGFFTIDLDKKVTLPTAEKLASWGSRYSKICRAMRPFCGALHRATAGRKNRHALFFLPEEAQRAIRGWRAMLYLVSFDEQQYARRIQSFRPGQLRYIIEFDASLSGAGVLWYERLDDGTEVTIGGSAVDLRGFEFGSDSSFQNTAEYIGCTLGLTGLALLGIKDVDVEIRGDSVAALTWAETERPRGEVVTNASMVFTLLVINFGLDIKKSVHISGEDNWRCDKLSRLSESQEGLREALMGMELESTRIINLQDNCHVQKLLSSCSPKRCLNGEQKFLDFWGEIRGALEEISREVIDNSSVPTINY